MTSGNDRGDVERGETSPEKRSRVGRREVIKVGALLVPTIVTLHATPAWAQTDYTITAYRYGVNAGKCRNPNFNPNASPNSPNGKEFIECGTRTRGRDHDSTSDQQSSGPIDF